MTVTTMTSREFNQDTGRAKRAARDGPVYITDRGERSHVLITAEEYERLRGGGRTLYEYFMNAPAIDGIEDIEFEIPARTVEPSRFVFD